MLLSFLIVLQAARALECVSSGVSLQIKSSGNFVSLRTIHANGLADLNLYNGPVTAPMLDLITRAKTDLASLGPGLSLRYRQTDCEFSKDKHYLLICRGPGEILFPTGTTLSAGALSTRFESSESLSGVATRFLVNVGIDLPPDSSYQHHFVDFGFDPAQCDL